MTLRLKHASLRLSKWIERESDQVDEQRTAVESYGTVFRPDNLDNITAEDFGNFLDFKYNKHWHGIYHFKSTICSDIAKLRTTLGVLLDESDKETHPIQDRLDRITDKNNKDLYIKGLNKAVLTPILMCAYPNDYAVYNQVSEVALIWLGLLRPQTKESVGERYVEVH